MSQAEYQTQTPSTRLLRLGTVKSWFYLWSNPLQRRPMSAKQITPNLLRGAFCLTQKGGAAVEIPLPMCWIAQSSPLPHSHSGSGYVPSAPSHSHHRGLSCKLVAGPGFEPAGPVPRTRSKHCSLATELPGELKAGSQITMEFLADWFVRTSACLARRSDTA